MGAHIHRLSEVDADKGTAVCANCGPVRVYSNGNVAGKRYWRCEVVDREKARRPERQAYIAQYNREYLARTGGVSQRKSWLKRYGLTIEDYDRMFEVQNGVCAICGRPQPEGKEYRNLDVDHCHEEGTVRGLLCRNCNRAIGLLEHNVEWLQSAIDYLQRSRQAS